jgi:hypothetical protein
MDKLYVLPLAVLWLRSEPFTQTVEYARGLLKLVREENVV